MWKSKHTQTLNIQQPKMGNNRKRNKYVMMKKTILFIIIFSAVLCLTSKSQEFILRGTLIGVEDGTEIRLNPYQQDGAVDIDDETKIFLKNGMFEYKRRLNQPTKFSLRTMPKIPPDNPLDYEFCSFWAENNEMTFIGKKGEILLAKVTGSSIQKQYEEMILEITDENKKSNDLKIYYTNNKSKLSDEEKRDLQIQGMQCKKEIVKIKHAFVLQHPEYYFTGEEIVYNINQFAQAYTKNEIAEFYNGMPSELKMGKYGIQIAEFLRDKFDDINTVPLQIGNKPPDFTLPDSKNTNTTFSKIKGKIILLDFWGSGCLPCRKEHVNYVALYDKYRNKGFEIISVSQDNSKKKWLDAMEKDKMTWISLWDADSKISRMNYLVTALPTNFLINEKGIIVAKDLRGENLENEIEKQFK